METCHSAEFILWFVFTAAKSPTEFIWMPWIHSVSPNAHVPAICCLQSFRHMQAMQAINLWMILNDIDLRMWEGTLWLSRFTFEAKIIHRSWSGLWDFRCASVAQCAAGITSYRQFHGISWHESCRLKLQRKKSRLKRCRTHPCVAITACYYSIIGTCTWQSFVDVCCCIFDINMGNMVIGFLGA